MLAAYVLGHLVLGGRVTSINTFNEGHLMVTVLTEVVSNFGVAFLCLKEPGGQ